MGFQTGLSGLNASSKNLDVVGNNIANVNTTGFKNSRAEFTSLVASSVGPGTSTNAAGLGVAIDAVAQQFSQGNLTITGNALDLAINGAGFFQLELADGSIAYSRAGNFKLDNNGSIITNTGASLRGYPTDTAGVATSTTPGALVLPTGAPVAAQATTSITAELNLDASDTRVYNAGTDTPPRTTYGTALTVFDTQGSPIAFGVNFTRAASTAAAAPAPALDNWDVRDSAGTVLFQLRFDSTGSLYAPATNPTVTIATPSPTTPDISATLDVSGITQFAAAFGVTNLSQDGYTSGSFVSLSISETGVITARYSNGESQAAGMVALADFRNVQGLAPVGGNNWIETFTSGQPLLGQPGQGKFGVTRAGALEDSNVDLTAELVNMMTAQRAYQANAQTIKTQDQVMQTLVNLR
ncbi:flagellar hook protein FlgE [Methyloversatilis sp.]|uniref:flagellar hook protein FlgE n=1 Tax=Methyloversatilis sp. TaxID=2569862 RepID=UPI00273279A4|nr:flagellar hook protein FlgE [Methyloversatilis sp.]MDP3577787.1 flagellar hook protein FlgE [Methyloversatilis sp.]